MSDVDHLLERASALLELGRPADAEHAALEALAADPTSAPAFVVLTRALDGQRRFDEAVGAGRSAVAADPDLADAYVALAWALVGDGRADDAVAVAGSAVALEPHEPACHHALGWALLSSSPPRHQEAHDAAARAIELEPGATPAYSVLGLALAGLGRRREGRKVLREGLRINPHDPYLHNNLAKIDLDRGLRIGRTGRHLSAAAGAIPQEPVVHRNLDTLLVRFAMRLVWPTLVALSVLRLQVALDAPWWSRAVTGAVYAGLAGLMVAWFSRQVPRGLRFWARGVLARVALPVRLIALAMLAFAACVVATAFAPTSLAAVTEQAAGVLLRLAFVLAAVLLVAHLVQRRRHRRG
ncbi:tetratricopeptide repeat protein [Nocardioides hwasunensis]|uniref:Tetratricopeptide repeat protein n=1 Tax=Nocardioides hwasunensis TaxID=397258 RepID=A0ABR8MBT3_9ACTN|nr:tetratricopeptide repeat protein [Nocardioides hwasunensis]MBD3913308.1 tetratricopeptide repeat protein [Nocardioides hwasunensis]